MPSQFFKCNYSLQSIYKQQNPKAAHKSLKEIHENQLLWLKIWGLSQNTDF
jgi:hypothetical protein